MQQLDQYDEGFVERGFDAVAARYGEVPFLRGAAEVLVDMVADQPITRALDVGTGPGTTALGLAQPLMSTGFRALVEALEPAAGERFERAHKAEVRSLLTPRGLWIDVPVIVAWGRKP